MISFTMKYGWRRSIPGAVRLLPGCAVLVAVILAGCRTPAEETPLEPPPAAVRPAPPPPPPQEPEGVPEPEPEPRAPLEGPTWVLEQQYGTSRIPAPPAGTITVTFAEGEMNGFGGVNRLTGGYTYQGPGVLSIGPLATTRAAGPFLRYETQFLENMALVRGYYITGDIREESRLTLFGGVGREEIILAEFSISLEDSPGR